MGLDDSGLFAAGARAFGTELRDLAGAPAAGASTSGISTLEEANRFLSEYYIDVFNREFAVAPEQRASAFRRSGRPDLDWIFTIQTERMVAKDNTVAIGDRVWQIEKFRFRSTLAGCTVTIHEHLDGRVSLRFGPHGVGRFGQPGRTTYQSQPTESPWQRRLAPPKPKTQKRTDHVLIKADILTC